LHAKPKLKLNPQFENLNVQTLQTPKIIHATSRFPYHTYPIYHSHLEIKSAIKKKHVIGQTLGIRIWKREVGRVCNLPKEARVVDKDANEREFEAKHKILSRAVQTNF
jgi:hypothetical protein